MKLSVIICTYSLERLQDTVEAVNSILSQSYVNTELIISVDHNLEVLEALKKEFSSQQITYALNDQVKGLSDTRNAGIKSATGDIIAFIDDDAVADQDWAQRLMSSYNNPSVIAVGGKLNPLWENHHPWWFPPELNWVIGCTYKGHPETKTEVRNLIGCNMSFRREVFEKVGEFSTSIGRLNKIPLSGEEMEFCLRVKQFYPDKIILYNPGAIVKHRVAKYREALMYVIRRSYAEGFSKKIIKSSFLNAKVLSLENSYLKYLFGNAFPFYFINTIKLNRSFSCMCRLSVILVSIFFTGVGYLGARLPK